jgi:uncharacterized protein (TIGR03083 family)
VATIVDKTRTVDLLRREFAALDGLCSELAPADWDTPTCLPGWSVRDVLSHVIGTEAGLLGETAPKADVSHLHHMRNPIAEANEVWVESLRGADGDQMRRRFADVTGRRLAVLDGLSQADFDAPSWTPAGRDETYGRFMRIRHYDCFMHENDIRDALGLPLDSDPDHLGSALDEVATGLGYIVGKRAGIPEGSRVEIDLTGPATARFLIAVDDRARVVERLDDLPTIGLRLPTPLFLRLTGGRKDLHPGEGDQIVVSGDKALGEQLVENLAFTI